MNEEQTPPPLEVVTPSTVTQKQDWLKPLTTVTPLSKYLAMLLFVVLPFVGFWLGIQYSAHPVVTSEPLVSVDGDLDIPPSPALEQLPDTQNMLGTLTEASDGSVLYHNDFYQFAFYYPPTLLYSTDKDDIPDTESNLSIQESITPEGKLVLFMEGINHLRSPSVTVSKNESKKTQEQVYQECLALKYGRAEIIPWGDDTEGVSCDPGEMSSTKVTVVTPSFLYSFGDAGYWREGGIAESFDFYAPTPTIRFVTPGSNGDTWKIGTSQKISWEADVGEVMTYALHEIKNRKYVEEDYPGYAIRLREANSSESDRYIVGSTRKNTSLEWIVGEVTKSYGEGDESAVTLKPSTYYLEIHFVDPFGLLFEPLIVNSPMFTISD